ncbi:hypothetical protein D3C75_830230 [compost metagenome]
MQEQVDRIDQRFAGFTHLNQGNPHQDRKQDDLEHDAIRERADKSLRDDVHEKIDGATLLTGGLAVLGDGTAIQCVNIDVHPNAWLYDVNHNKADDQGDG